MKNHLYKAFLLLLTLALLLPLYVVSPAASGEEELKYMAYNFYSNPDLSNTSGRYDSFMIDFRSDKTPLSTYWALANFGMDLSSPITRRAYPNITGYGAYAGLQNSNNKMGILSFWEASYKKNGQAEKLTATRIFPDGISNFGGEGEGTNCIMPYNWQEGKWYRMLLHTWQDSQKGSTFAGMWLLDVESGEWTLFSYFDTHLYNSCLTGNLSQFMENYWGGDPTTNCNVERTCHLKNMYVLDHETEGWISLPTATLSYGDGGAVLEHQKKYGAHSFGATNDFFWGSTGGKVENQEEYEKEATKYATYTINQPENPFLGAPVIQEIRFTDSIVWEMAENSTPQLSYNLKIVDTTGKTIYQKSATRPEVHSETPNKITQNDAVKCILTVTDVFGNSTTGEFATEAYQKAIADKENEENITEEDGKDPVDTPTPPSSEIPPSETPDTPEIPQTPEVPETPNQPQKSSSSWNISLIIGIVITAVVIAIGAAVTFFILLKKKR